MLNVILCDDDPAMIKTIQECIEGYILMEGWKDVKIELATDDPIKVLDLFRKNVTRANGKVEQVARPLKHRLLYLDIDLGELGRSQRLDGISLGSEIRKFDIGADIAFLTSNRVMVSDVLAHKIAPISFLSKPFDESRDKLTEEVTDLLNFAYNRMSKSLVDNKRIGFKTGNRKTYSNLADIYYIKINDKRNSDEVDNEIKTANTILYEAGGKLYLKGTLSFYDKRIPELVRLGKFHLVNPQKVEEALYSGKYVNVTMSDGYEICVTRKAFDDYEIITG